MNDKAPLVTDPNPNPTTTHPTVPATGGAHPSITDGPIGGLPNASLPVAATPVTTPITTPITTAPAPGAASVSGSGSLKQGECHSYSRAGVRLYLCVTKIVTQPTLVQVTHYPLGGSGQTQREREALGGAAELCYDGGNVL